MRKILFIMTLILPLLISNGSWGSSLPECEGSPVEVGYIFQAVEQGWDNCQGTLTTADGDQYVGEFKDDKRHGQGTHTWADGDQYVGEFNNGDRHGQGTFTWPSGHQYVGEYRDNRRVGQGTYTWPDGRKYVGEHKDGLRTGQGTLTWPDGDQYVGEFRDGKRNGQGTLTYSDGSEYVGEFKDDMKHGEGIYSFKGFLGLNKKQEGIWKEDEFLYKSNVSLISDEDREFCHEIGFEPNTSEYDNCVQKSAKRD